ncbi:mitotic spindle checkpoint protein Bub3, partial [Quaeritorhiza haematococci]
MAMAAVPHTQYELLDPPTDGITSVSFAPDHESLLLVSSWDKNVRLYDVHENRRLLTYSHSAAVLDVCFQNSNTGFSGGLDRRVK